MRKVALRSILIAGTLLALIAGSEAHASSTQFGYVSQIYAMANGAVLFNVDAPRTGRPGCQGPGLDARFALDASTVAGQAQVAVLLNAYNLHKRISVVGQSGCSIWADTETVFYFTLQD